MEATEKLFAFASRLGKEDQVFVLGDLFDYWVGDDQIQHPYFADVAKAWQEARGRGADLFFLGGNRDFLVGQGFSKASGMTLLSDVEVLSPFSALVTHGDLLCTEDSDYQAFRAMTRAPGWREAFLASPLADRLLLAGKARQASEEHLGEVSPDVADVHLDAVVGLWRAQGRPRHFIHGHTHRPGRHEHFADGTSFMRWVLPDWQTQAGALLFEGDSSGRGEDEPVFLWF